MKSSQNNRDSPAQLDPPTPPVAAADADSDVAGLRLGVGCPKCFSRVTNFSAPRVRALLRTSCVLHIRCVREAAKISSSADSDDALIALLDSLDLTCERTPAAVPTMAGRVIPRVPRFLRAESFALAPAESSSGVRVLATGPVSVHSCRAMREFGASRFAIVSPSLPRGAGAGTRGGGGSNAGARLLQAAIVSGFTVGGRRWEWLHGKFRSSAALFFSPDADGDSNAASVRAWHIPSPAALSVHKYSARMDLAFSKSVPAGRVAFSGERSGTDAQWEIRHAPDAFASATGELLTDGCAGAGTDVLLAASSAVTAEGGDAVACVPGAFQGRLGGYKGVWYHDPTLPRDVITVRPSQRKLDINLSASATQTTATQRDVEVLRVARDRGVSALNPQISLLLAGWGVSSAVFCSLVREATVRARDALTSEEAARSLLSSAGAGAGDDAIVEARALLRAGLWGEPRLTSLLSRIAARTLGALSSRGRVPVPSSRTVMVIADPTGTLAANQVFFWPSSQPRPISAPMLVARNPCHAPDDISVVDGATFSVLLGGEAGSQWEAALRDVLVMSVQGDSSPVGALAGGDYDGDVVWVTWERALVEPVAANKAWVFAHGPPVSRVEPPRPAASGTGSGFAKTTAPASLAPPSVHALADVYLSSLTDATLGHATNLHLAWVDKALSDEAIAEDGGAPAKDGPPAALWSRQALALTSLCRILVDAAKTGAAPPLPDWLKSVAYPHWARAGGGTGGGSRGTGRPTVRSRSAIGVMHDKVLALSAEREAECSAGRAPSAAAPPPAGERASQNLGSIEQFVGLSAPTSVEMGASAAAATLRPHPLLVSLSERHGWRGWRALAESHLNAFIADCTGGRSGSDDRAGGISRGSSGSGDDSSEVSGGESDGGSSASGDDGDSIADGFASASSSFLEARARARRRLVFTEARSGGDDVERSVEQRTALALAYYRVSWARWESGGSARGRSEPHQFPWIAAGDEIVSAALAAQNKRE